MRYLYTLLSYLALPLIVARLLFRARKMPAYRHRLSERFAWFKKPGFKNPIWIHAVSLGEVIAATPLIRQLQQSYPEQPFVITCTTPTGSARIKTLFGNTVFHVYAPYDLPFTIQGFLRRIQPRILILIETELWPNWIHYCAERKIPICLANARLSEKSARGYQRFASLTKTMLRNIQLLLAQTQADADRFCALGMSPESVHITGSIKFDLEIPEDLLQDAARLRNQWGYQRPILIAGSTHPGEENIVLAAFAEIKTLLPETLLLLVPRHPERCPDVVALCHEQGYRTALRSRKEDDVKTADIFIGDTTGELLLFYAIADIALVGGSLLPIGGHNLLEPSAVGTPCLTGPHTFNFTEIRRLLEQSSALFPVDSAETLAKASLTLLTHPEKRQHAAQQALQTIRQNRGALTKQLGHIKTLITV